VPDDAHAARVRRLTDGRTDSTLECTAAELRAIRNEYQAQGWRPRPPRKAGRRPPPPERLLPGDMLTRVEQLLTELGRPWDYAESILRRQRGHGAGVAAPLHLADPDELRGVIAALDRHHKRLADRTAAERPQAAQESAHV